MRLLVLIEDIQSATSFYRTIGPLQALRRKCSDLDIVLNVTTLDWPTLYGVDAVYMHRPYAEPHLNAAKLVKDLNVPLWIDHDDDLFSVPVANPAHSTYNAPLVQDRIKEILGLADVVTCTTEALRRVLAPHSKRVDVIPNALDERLLRWGYQAGPRQPHISVVWRGGETHRMDLQSVGEDVVRLAEKHPTVQWHFLGNDKPWHITSRIKGVVHSPGGLYLMNYFKTMGSLAPDVVMVPLENNPFNHAKSNIGWLEATLAGAVCVAPEEIPEWDRPGIMRYDAGQFAFTMDRVLSPGFEREDYVQASWAYIKEHLMLSKVNHLRQNLLQGLLK